MNGGHVVVVGATGGAGPSVVRELADGGFRVTFTGRSAETVARVQSMVPSATGRILDGTNAAATRTLGHLGRRLAWQLRQPSAQGRRLAGAQSVFVRAGQARLERANLRVSALELSLAHLNPQAVLQRGYAIVTKADGAIVHDTDQLAIGEAVAVALARGSASARIESVAVAAPKAVP